MYMKHPRGRARFIPCDAAIFETLEVRRLFSDLAFGNFKLSGDPLFHPGGTTIVTVQIRDLDGVGVAAGFTVGFKYVDVGFREDDEDVSYDDPTAVALESTATTIAVPASPTGQSYTFDVAFPTSLKQGRYELIGKVDDGNTVVETNENDNTRAFGAGRVLPADGDLLVAGSDNDDRISITAYSKNHQPRYLVNVNGGQETFSATRITAFDVEPGAGDDTVELIGAVANTFVSGGDGADKLIAGDLAATLSGGAGNDTLMGGAGNDQLSGNGGNDRLYGNGGNDRLYGDNGNDYMDGGAGADRLTGGDGMDTLLGQGGNDRFTTRDGFADQLFGGSGKDSATVDSLDVLNSIETSTVI